MNTMATALLKSGLIKKKDLARVEDRAIASKSRADKKAAKKAAHQAVEDEWERRIATKDIFTERTTEIVELIRRGLVDDARNKMRAAISKATYSSIGEPDNEDHRRLIESLIDVRTLFAIPEAEGRTGAEVDSVLSNVAQLMPHD